MNDQSEGAAAEGRTVQQYLDETPQWADGTALFAAPMTPMQVRIWGLAAAGKFFEGLVVFMTGVALPLISQEFGLGAAEHGVVSAASLFGILVGALALGGLADHFGRKRMFVVEMALFCLFLILLAFSQGYLWLVVCLFGVGVALGCDYPTAHMIISESIPSRSRGRLVLGAFAFQALGALTGTGVGYLILAENPSIEAWRWMYASAVIPALLVLAGRFFVTESPHWLFATGRHEDAERETARLLARTPAYPREIRISRRELAEGASHRSRSGWIHLFNRKNRRATILASVPWFLQDLGTYGIGIFTPTILAAAIGTKSAHPHNLTDIIGNDLLAAKGAAFIDILLIVGVAFAIVLADRLGRIPLQVFGFVGCAIGLFVASVAVNPDGSDNLTLLFVGFMLFNFMTNLGPNAQTYLLAGEVFPTALRGKGAGFAAAFAKIGAVMTAFLFPILLADVGVVALLYILVATSLVGAVVSWVFRIETTGVSLDSADR